VLLRRDKHRGSAVEDRTLRIEMIGWALELEPA